VTATMRAFQIDRPGGAADLRLVELPVHEPGPGQLRVRVAYCGLNPLDVIVRRGGAAWMVPPWPLTLGVEHSGVVDAVGEGVDAAWLGRGVVSRQAFGGNAEFSVAAESNLVRLPDDMDLTAGAVYRGCSHTAWRIIHEAVRIPLGAWALFHSAAGPVGIMLTQFARAAGLRVIGLVGGAGKQAYAAQFGAHHLIDTQAAPDWAQEVRRLTGQAGAHLIVDGNGGAESARNFEVVAPGGEVVFIGATSGMPAAATPPGQLIVLHAAARGFNLNVAERIGASAEAVDAQIIPLLQSGAVKLPITSVSPFEAIPELHRRFENREIQGRAVIEVGGEAVERLRRKGSAEPSQG
jgi:NADPH:quinone reductase